MPVLYTNNAASALSASITNTATSFSVTAGHGARFPAISGGDHFYATLIDTAGNIEIVRVTARATDTLTVARAQDGTTGRAFSAGDRVELRLTKLMLDDIKTDTRAALTSTNVTTALGFTPYNATNPSGYISQDGNARVGVENNGTLIGTRRRINFIPGTGISLSIADDSANEEVDVTINSTVTAPVQSVFGRTGAVTLGSGDVTGALGYTPLSTGGGTVTGVTTFSNASDAQIVLNGAGTSWAGITWTDVGGTDYTWFNGATSTFAIGGGGSAVSGKKLHVHGGMTVGANYASTANPTNGLNVEGAIQQAGNQVLHAGNFSSYALPVGGGTITSSSDQGLTISKASGWNYLGFSVGGTRRTYFGVDSGGNPIWGADSGTMLLAGNVSVTGNNVMDFGPNSSWGATLRVGGNGHTGSGRASVVTTNGNLHLDGSANNGVYFGWYNSGTTGVYFGNGAGGQVGRIDGGGTATFNGNVTANSDERLKKDWAELPIDFIERLATVKSGTYTRIDGGERQAGASAQDMKKLLTEVVIVAPDEQGTLSLAYGNAALVSAIELSKRVLRLEAQLAKLIET